MKLTAGTLSWLGSRGPIDAPLLSNENMDELRLSDMSEENTDASENVDIVDGGRAVSDVREPNRENSTYNTLNYIVYLLLFVSANKGYERP